MQLILTHADLEQALIEKLNNQGMTAFVPGKASVEFSFKRGTKELVCVLDTDPQPKAEAEPKAPTEAPKSSGETQSATTSAPVVQTQASAPAGVANEPAATAPAETAATTTEAPVETAAPAGGDDNLFD